MAFNGMTLTVRGRSLQAKVQAGATLTFTKTKVGDGSLPPGGSLEPLNDLIGPKLVVPIQDVSVIGDGTCRVRGVLTNTDLATGFFVREIGVFATDPDLGEILYAIANAGDECDYLPAGGGAVAIEHVLDIVISVGNAANVTAVINESAVLATKADLSAHVGAGGNAHALATAAAAGFMSEADKAKLDGINAESLSATVNAHKTAAPLDHPDGSVTAAKLASGAALANLGYTPLNKDGDTMTGALNVNKVQISADPNGAIAIGDSAQNGITPYIDFHYGKGGAQSYNVRLINDADGNLSFLFGSGAGTLKVVGDTVYTSGNFTAVNNIGILSGVVSNGGTIPLPNGFTQAQCVWLVSMNNSNVNNYRYDIDEGSATGYWYRSDCRTDANRVVTATQVFYAQNTHTDVTQPGSANYIIIGVK